MGKHVICIGNTKNVTGEWINIQWSDIFIINRTKIAIMQQIIRKEY